MNIPTEMFTVAALGRLPGWIAQWKEMRENKETYGSSTSNLWRNPELLKKFLRDNFLIRIVKNPSLLTWVFYI
jgi:hypothetical protein